MATTVDVCCKLPGGLHLTVFRMEDSQELLQGGSTRVVKRAVADGRVTVRGIGRREDDPRIIGRYAVTRGVDADFWARWLEENASSDLVKNRLIFAGEKPAVVEGQAREQAALRSGLEPLDPSRPPPEFARKIEKAKV
jgi:hypothetical protein